MGVAWLLPCGYTVSGVHNHAKGVDHPLPGTGLGRCGKALTGYGICFNSAMPRHWVWAGLWPNSHVGTSLPSPPIHSGRGAPEADIAGWGRYQLAICLHMDEWCCGPCTFVQWRHIGIMTEGLPSMNACSCLSQLQVWKLLQCRGWVVCPEGLNGSLKALLFDFGVLIWNVANADEPTQDLPMIDVDLSGMEPEVSPSTRIEDPLGLNLRGESTPYVK